ncbi:hypothetical protein MMC25_004616 [Agyrium rufum]|nr:hypothetical protein [Agyrium rufum]
MPPSVTLGALLITLPTLTSQVATTPSSAIPARPPLGPGDHLNTLANHNLLPHNGRNITVQDTVTALKIGLNFGSDVITTVSTAVLAQCSALYRYNCTSFDLNVLHEPYAGKDDGLLPSVWHQSLDVWSSADAINFKLANVTRKTRTREANGTDLPGWFGENDTLSFLEAAFYLSSMGDTVKGNALKKLAKYRFEQERLPLSLGWSPLQRAEIT